MWPVEEREKAGSSASLGMTTGKAKANARAKAKVRTPAGLSATLRFGRDDSVEVGTANARTGECGVLQLRLRMTAKNEQQ